MSTPRSSAPSAVDPSSSIDLLEPAAEGNRALRQPSPRSLRVLSGEDGEFSGRVLRERYEVLGLLGRGGMAEVYEARFLPAKNKRVAVKILRQSLSKEFAPAKRFAREFAILYEVQHRNLVHALDYDRTEDGQLFMVMERLHGRSLEKLRGALSPERVVTIGKQLASVLKCLHGMSVIHRDLKPSNVILLDEEACKRGGPPVDHVKLLDLGVARLGPDCYRIDRPYMTPPEERELTKSGYVVGTPRYIPPEAGDAPPTKLWDIYALGVLLWQLACGCLPPKAWRVAGVMRGLPEGQVGLPTLLERTLRGAMCVDPKRRFASIEDFMDAWEEVEAELSDPGVQPAAKGGSADPGETKSWQRKPMEDANWDQAALKRHPRHWQGVLNRASKREQGRIGVALRWLVLGILLGCSAGMGIALALFDPRDPGVPSRSAELWHEPVAARADYGPERPRDQRTELSAVLEGERNASGTGAPGSTSTANEVPNKQAQAQAQARPSRSRRARSSTASATTWAHEHGAAIKRCFASGKANSGLGAVDIKLTFDASGALKTTEFPTIQSSLRRRCLRELFVGLRIEEGRSGRIVTFSLGE